VLWLHLAMSLSEEQKKRIEESRQKALALRASRQQNSTDKLSAGTPVAAQTPQGPSIFSSTKSTHLRENVCKDVPKKPSCMGPSISSNFKQSVFTKSSTGCITTAGRTSTSTGGVKPAGSSGKSAGADKVLVKCVLTSSERFAVDMQYCPAVIDIFKRMNSRQYGR
jgi:hypothetical protein